MEEQIKTTIPNFEDKKKKDDTNTAKYLMIIFVPIIVAIIFCFRYQTLRIISLCLSGFGMGYSSYKTYKARGRKFDKETVSQVTLVVLTVLGIFYKFFADLVLSYWAIALSIMLLMLALKIEDQKQKLYFIYYVFLGAILTAIILNYHDVKLLFRMLGDL